jgi:hypothetical protein
MTELNTIQQSDISGAGPAAVVAVVIAVADAAIDFYRAYQAASK